MDDAIAWKALLDAWPAGVPRSGVLVTTLGEQIPFDGFLHGDRFLLLERKTPDTMGARKILLPLNGISQIKFTDVVQAQAFGPWGFEGTIGAKKASH